MMVSGGPAFPINKKGLVIDPPLQAGGTRQACSHTEALSYDVGLAAMSYVFVATERTGRYKTVVSSSFFSLYVQVLCFWRFMRPWP
jgi:hypothetical protein